MVADDFNRPLGTGPRPRGANSSLTRFLAGAGLVLVVAVAGFVLLVPRPEDAVVTAERPRPAPEPAVLTDVTPLPAVDRPGDVLIRDPGAESVRVAALADPDLLAPTAHGPVPRIGADGRRPLDAYAAPLPDGGSGPRIAIVVGGLGLSAAGTEAAIDLLPSSVTLAFAPYGDDLETLVATARQRGHELLLQVPLEPFDYPNTDPGEHTLTVDAHEAETRDEMDWLLSRISAYVGVVNYMGARFTSDGTALAIFLAAIGDHGLMYLDDGSSARSLVGDLAPGRAPYALANVVLDPIADGNAIDQNLARLEQAARANGSAIGVATAFPLSIDRIVVWAEDAARRGIVIVPVSALAKE